MPGPPPAVIERHKPMEPTAERLAAHKAAHDAQLARNSAAPLDNELDARINAHMAQEGFILPEPVFLAGDRPEDNAGAPGVNTAPGLANGWSGRGPLPPEGESAMTLAAAHAAGMQVIELPLEK